MMDAVPRLKRISIFAFVGLLLLLTVAALVTPYPFPQLFKKSKQGTPGSKRIDTRYVSEVNGIVTSKDMWRQYKAHPEEYKFTIAEDFGVMYAYADPNIAWTGMVFIHHFPSVSEVVLDYDGHVIYEHITVPEVGTRIVELLGDETFIVQIQSRMDEIWGLTDPGVEVNDFVESLQATGNKVEFLGGRPQTLLDANMFMIRVNDIDISLYAFEDESARRNASEDISPDGYEFSEYEGEMTTIIHMEWVAQPNFWAKDSLLVQYLGQDQGIIDILTVVLGDPITVNTVTENQTKSWNTYANPFFGITLEYPADWEHVDGEPHYGEKYAGVDGFFKISAMRSEGLTLDLAVQREAQHRLLPYGTDPTIEEYQVQGRNARLILPTIAQEDEASANAALLVWCPETISLVIGSEDKDYSVFVLYSDPAHVRRIAESLRFVPDLHQESKKGDVLDGFPPCQMIPEVPAKVCWPSDYSILKISEANRRGSFVAYGFHVNGISRIPTLSEIQFFSAESIRTFTRKCDENTLCFFGDYPDLDRFHGLKVAFADMASYQDYALKMFGDRPYFVKNLPCYGDDCVIREYTTYLKDTMVVVWIVMLDETQGDLSDALVSQLKIVKDYYH